MPSLRRYFVVSEPKVETTSKPISSAKVVPAVKAGAPVDEDAGVTATAAPLGD